MKPNKIKTGIKLFVAALFFLLLNFACGNSIEKTRNQDNSDKIISKIDSVAQSYYDRGQLAGFAVAVLRDGDTLYNRAFGYGNLEKKLLATEQTKFAIASVTKLHTATLTLKLVEQGKLSLDQTLLEVMPDFPRPDQARKITIRHLLSHTSGLMDYAEYVDSLFVHDKIQPTRQTYLDFLEKQELHFEPGTSFSYTNTGFILMAFIIEGASGMLYEDFIEQTIAQPLGIASLKHLSRNFGASTSRNYQLADSTFVRSDMDSVYYFKGDGGLSATVLDLAHVPFGLADGKIISQESLEEMMQSVIFPDGNRTGYGLGMRTGNFEGHRVWGHTGGHRNFWATLAFFPDDRLCVAVLNNTDDAPVDALWIEGDVALAALGLEIPDLESMEQKNSNLSMYVGEYAHVHEAYVSERKLLILQYPDDKNLYRNRPNRKTKGVKLYYLGNHTFAPANAPMDRMVFNFDNNGKLVGLQDYYNGLFLEMKKKVE